MKIAEFRRKHLEKFYFWLRVKKYLAFNHLHENSLLRDIFLLLLQTLIKKGAFAFFLVLAISYIDNMVLSIHINDGFVIKNENMMNIIILGISVAGIFIALFCDTLASVYSSKYANAPSLVVSLFESDPITKGAINFISVYIVFSFILLIFVSFDHAIGVILTICFILFTISVIISFGLFGYSRNRLSDTNRIALKPRQDILYNIQQATCEGPVYCDSIFQHSFSDKSFYDAKTIEEIALFNINSNVNVSSLINFVEENNYLIAQYWAKKIMIPYNSKWYRNTWEYRKWHFAGDMEISMALRSGTFLQPEGKLNVYWLEDELLQINTNIFDFLIKNQKWHDIIIFLDNLDTLSYKAIMIKTLKYYLNIMNNYHHETFNLCLKYLTTKDKPENTESVAAIIQKIFENYLNIIVSVNKFLDSFDYSQLVNTAIKYTKYDKKTLLKAGALNNAEGEKLLSEIEIECSIEGKRITSDWYIEEIVAHKVYDYLCELVFCLDIMLNVSFDYAGRLATKDLLIEAMCSYSSIIQMDNKIKNFYKQLSDLMLLLQSKHIETDVVWEDNGIELLGSNISSKYQDSIDGWANCAIRYYGAGVQKDDKQPDLLGGCYNYVCDDLITSLCELDFKDFESKYNKLLRIVMVYQPFIKNDTDKIKGDFRRISVANVLTKPILEYLEISGYAYVFGELVDERWKQLVMDSLKNIDENLTSSANQFYLRLIDIGTFARERMGGIFNRDIIETGWKTRIWQAIMRKKLLKYKISNDYSFPVEELDTKNNFLKAFLGNSKELFFQNSAYEAFLIMCINKKVQSDKKFESNSKWEQRLNDDE